MNPLATGRPLSWRMKTSFERSLGRMGDEFVVAPPRWNSGAANRSNPTSRTDPEIRNPKEGQNPKPETRFGATVEKVRCATSLERYRSGFGLRISFGSRISDFGFRANVVRMLVNEWRRQISGPNKSRFLARWHPTRRSGLRRSTNRCQSVSTRSSRK